MNSPRIALFGFGAIGRHHARNLAASPACTFVGVVDPSPEARSDAQRLGYTTFAEPGTLFDQGIDAAIVAVPTAFHHELGLRLIDQGIPILVEKPIAATLAQGQELIDASRLRSLPIMVGYVERFNPAIIAAAKLMKDGLVGAPLHIATRRVGTMPPRVKDANVIVDIGVHDIDIISLLLQSELTLISAQGGMALIDDRVDYASLSLDAGGIAAHATVNWVTPVKVRDLTITGTTGFLQIDYLKQTAHFAPGRNFVPTESYEALLAQYEEGTLVECAVEKREPLRVQLDTFIDVLNGARPPDPAVALQSLRIAIEATELIERSFRTGVPQ